jgi:hypothetical protein
MLLADGFNDALVGYASRPTERAVYSVPKVLSILEKEHGMSALDALEWFEFNIEGAYVGEETPIWLHCMPPDEMLAAFGEADAENGMT